jgi:4-oxalocrotonate tautomerase
MPLVRIDVNEGRSERELRAIGDAIHEALVTTCGVPADDRFQVFTVHDPKTLIYDESFMAMHRSDGIVLVQVTFNAGRTTEQKVALYHRVAELLAEKAGVVPDDVFINLVEVQRENWSFGRGVAQLVAQPEKR